MVVKACYSVRVVRAACETPVGVSKRLGILRENEQVNRSTSVALDANFPAYSQKIRMPRPRRNAAFIKEAEDIPV